MARFAAVLLLSLLAAGGAHSATITNTNPAPVVLVITEGGNRVEVVVDAGASETLCTTGCFMTTPTVTASASMAARRSISSKALPS